MNLSFHSLTPEQVFEAVRQGSDPRAAGKLDGNTVLMTATKTSKDPAVLTALLEVGADHTARNFRGQTALHFAVERRDPRFAQVLLDAGAAVDVRDEDGKTALFDAVDYSQTLLLLLEHGADPNARKLSGDSVLYWAACFASEVDAVRSLVLYGANPNEVSDSDRTAFLTAAIINTNIPILEYLHSVCRAPSRSELESALVRAAYFNNNPEVIQFLVGVGADVNARDISGDTVIELMRGNENMRRSEKFWPVFDALVALSTTQDRDR